MALLTFFYIIILIIESFHPFIVGSWNIHLIKSYCYSVMILYYFKLKYLQTASTSMPTSTHDNVDEWKWKLSMFLRNGDEHELVSRERKDRRDFDHLSAMATRMGLFRYLSNLFIFQVVPFCWFFLLSTKLNYLPQSSICKSSCL